MVVVDHPGADKRELVEADEVVHCCTAAEDELATLGYVDQSTVDASSARSTTSYQPESKTPTTVGSRPRPTSQSQPNRISTRTGQFVSTSTTTSCALSSVPTTMSPGLLRQQTPSLPSTTRDLCEFGPSPSHETHRGPHLTQRPPTQLHRAGPPQLATVALSTNRAGTAQRSPNSEQVGPVGLDELNSAGPYRHNAALPKGIHAWLHRSVLAH